MSPEIKYDVVVQNTVYVFRLGKKWPVAFETGLDHDNIIVENIQDFRFVPTISSFVKIQIEKFIIFFDPA